MTCIIFLYIFFKKFQRSPSLTLDFMFRRKKRKETKKNNNNNKLYWGMYWRSHQKCWSNFPSQFATFEALFHSDQIGRSSTQPKPSCRTDPEGIQLWCWMPPPKKMMSFYVVFHPTKNESGYSFLLLHLAGFRKIYGTWILIHCIHHSHLLTYSHLKSVVILTYLHIVG